MEYFSFIAFYGAIWIVLLVFRRDLRKEMLVMTLLCIPLGVLGDYLYVRDYYSLPLLSGDAWIFFSGVFGGISGGVTAVLYETIYRGAFVARRRARVAHPRWFWAVLVAGSIAVFAGTAFSINSIYSSICVMLAGGGWMVYHRSELLRDALGSGILLVLVSAVFFSAFQYLFPDAFQHHWHLTRLSGVLIHGVPIEEYAWAFSWGFIVGPAYEYVLGARLRTK